MISLNCLSLRGTKTSDVNIFSDANIIIKNTIVKAIIIN